MSERNELVSRFKAFLDKNYPCCGVTGCCGEEEEANYLADIAYELMRPLTSVEIAARDRPEQMEAARAKVRADRKAALAEQMRVAREAAWQEGAAAQAFAYGMDVDAGPNPYVMKEQA